MFFRDFREMLPELNLLASSFRTAPDDLEGAWLDLLRSSAQSYIVASDAERKATLTDPAKMQRTFKTLEARSEGGEPLGYVDVPTLITFLHSVSHDIDFDAINSVLALQVSPSSCGMPNLHISAFALAELNDGMCVGRMEVSQELLDLEVKLRVAIIKSEISKRSNALELVRLFTCSCQAQFNPAKPDAGLLHAPAPYPTMPPRSSCRNHHPRELCQGRI